MYGGRPFNTGCTAAKRSVNSPRRKPGRMSESVRPDSCYWPANLSLRIPLAPITTSSEATGNAACSGATVAKAVGEAYDVPTAPRQGPFPGPLLNEYRATLEC
jgi:hypothetical protein